MRISRRLTNHNYSEEGLYFITLNTQNGVALFGDIYDVNYNSILLAK